MLKQVTTQAVIIISQVKQEAIPYVLLLAFDALVILQIVKISKHFYTNCGWCYKEGDRSDNVDEIKSNFRLCMHTSICNHR